MPILPPSDPRNSGTPSPSEVHYDPTEDGEPEPVERRITIITPSGPLGTPTETPSKKSVVRDLTPEDYEPPKSSDSDFPKASAGQSQLPSLKLDSPLPANVLTERTQSRVLGWNTETVRVVNHQTGIFTQLPTICAGTAGCPYGSICPVLNRDDFVGKSCPLEIREVFKHFSGYVLDLDVDPTSYVELQMVAQLVRHQLVLWQCDMNLRIEPNITEEVAVVAQKSGEVYYRPAINQHRTLQAQTETKIMVLYEKLIATRDAKQKQNRDANPDANISLMMARMSGFTTKQKP